VLLCVSEGRVVKELEMERDPSKIVYGMSLGLQRIDEGEEGGLTRTVKTGTKVGGSVGGSWVPF
jgi:hypothetical protein